MLELVVVIVAMIAMTVLFSLSLQIIHKQTTHMREIEARFLQRGQFNFEQQWVHMNEERNSTNQAIRDLAAWNTALCDSNVKMAAQFQSMLTEIDRHITYALTQGIERHDAKITEALKKFDRIS
jgi:hypothetical protein